MESLTEKIVKYSTELRLASISAGILSVATLAGTNLNLQELKVVEHHTDSKPSVIRVIQQESDENQQVLNNPKVVYSVQFPQKNLKIFLASLGLISGLIVLTLEKLLDDNHEAIQYHQKLDGERFKIKADTSIAIDNAVNKATIDTRIYSSLEKEFLNNPIAQKLANRTINTEAGLEEEETTDNTFLWEYDEPVTTYQDNFFTHQQALKIYELCKDGKHIGKAISEVTGYNPTNTNWERIKDEIINRIQEIKTEQANNDNPL